jgi:hypothetical protein
MLVSAGNCFASETQHQSVQSVINAFEQSIKTKDKSRFLDLFLDPAAPMIGVVSDKGMIARRAAVEKINKENNKDFVATKTWTTSANEMVEEFAADKPSIREDFHNVRVTSDDNIANVYFDYEYFKDNKKQHWGSESWLVVKTLTGWKINSVVYSITFIQQ